jgi:hypothetical protein
MFRIRRFNILKTSTVVALMYMVIVTVIFVPFLLLVGIAGMSVNDGPTQGAGAIGVLGIGVFVVLFYGILGWVFTAIACAVYNIVAGWVGGIEVQVEQVTPPTPPPAWLAPGTTPPSAPPTAPPPSAPAS